MNPTKLKIINSAMRLFSEKGFKITSVQEIADDCGIAKGMVYKFFESKDALFLEIYENCFRLLKEQSELIKIDMSLTPKEKLQQEIMFILHFFLEKKYILLKLGKHESNEVNQRIFQVRSWLFNWRKECLLRAYGEDIGENIWDVVVIYRGLLREYQYLIIEEDTCFLPVEEVAKFLVGNMDAIVKNIIETKPTPILKESLFKEDLNENLHTQYSCTTLNEIFDTMLLTLKTLPNNSYRVESKNSILLLRDEITQEQPRWFLIYALLLYLENEDLLVGLVKQITQHVRAFEKLSINNNKTS